MTNSVARRMAAVALVGALVLQAPLARGQAAAVVVSGAEPPASIVVAGPPDSVPKRYQTWSFFLICGQGWLESQPDTELKRLFDQFQLFGRAIGPKNLAVWFKRTKNGPVSVDNTDIERMSEYCGSFDIRPTQTPAVAVFTDYPDTKGAQKALIIQVNGSAAESRQALDALTSQLLSNRLDQKSLTRDQWMTKLANMTIGAAIGVGCYFNKVSISGGTAAIKVDLSHQSDKTC